MCRFALYLGPEIRISSLITEPDHSIVHQSYHAKEREEPLNGDGFGIAWYQDDGALVVFKDVSPAWSNLNLRSLAQAMDTTCLLAHVRAATAGLPVQQLNCHPFQWNNLTFMHNGSIGGFHQIRRAISNKLSNEAFQWMKGTTDSEHAFALWTDHYRSAASEQEPLGAMAEAMARTISDIEEIRVDAGIEEPSLLNFAVSNGSEAVVTRYISHSPELANTLYVHHGSRYTCENGQCLMMPDDASSGAVIVASEPLSSDAGWDRVSVGDMVLVTKERTLEIRSIA